MKDKIADICASVIMVAITATVVFLGFVLCVAAGFQFARLVM